MGKCWVQVKSGVRTELDVTSGGGLLQAVLCTMSMCLIRTLREASPTSGLTQIWSEMVHRSS